MATSLSALARSVGARLGNPSITPDEALIYAEDWGELIERVRLLGNTQGRHAESQQTQARTTLQDRRELSEVVSEYVRHWSRPADALKAGFASISLGTPIECTAAARHAAVTVRGAYVICSAATLLPKKSLSAAQFQAAASIFHKLIQASIGLLMELPSSTSAAAAATALELAYQCSVGTLDATTNAVKYAALCGNTTYREALLSGAASRQTLLAAAVAVARTLSWAAAVRGLAEGLVSRVSQQFNTHMIVGRELPSDVDAAEEQLPTSEATAMGAAVLQYADFVLGSLTACLGARDQLPGQAQPTAPTAPKH